MDSQKTSICMPVCSNCGLQVTAYSHKCNWCGSKLEGVDIKLGPTLLELLQSPVQFFSRFNEFHPTFLIMYIGYFLISFSQIVTHGVGKIVGTSNSTDIVVNLLSQAFVSSIFGAIVWLPLLVDIWLFISIKLFKGKADLKLTVTSIGYAFFWPGLFSLVSTAMSVGSYILLSKGLYFVALGLQLITVLWSAVIAGIAIKTINDFSILKTFLILLWPISLPLVILLVRVI